jgi:hypothetical protein
MNAQRIDQAIAKAILEKRPKPIYLPDWLGKYNVLIQSKSGKYYLGVGTSFCTYFEVKGFSKFKILTFYP